MKLETRNQNGVTVIAAIFAVLLMGAMGAGLAYFTASNQQTRVQQVTRDQAYYSNVAGMEYALGQILTGGSASSSFTRKFAGETFTVTRAGGTMTIQTSKKDAQRTHSINDPFDASACLVIDASAAAVNAPYTQITGITMSRDPICTQAVVINSMTTTNWSPNGGENLTGIQIAANPVEFSGSAGSGGTFDFGANDYTINDANQHALTYVQWGSAINGKTVNLVFNFTYNGTLQTKTVAVSTSNQAQSFTFQSGGCRLELTAGIWKQLTGCTVTNIGADPIKLTSLTLSWTPLSPSRDLKVIKIEGVNVVNSTIASGEFATLSPQYTLNAGTTHDISQFLFSDEMMSKNYTMIWGFEDGSTANVDLPLFAPDQGVCHTINAGPSYIYENGSTHQIKGLTVQNTCGQDVGVVSMSVSWTGNPSLKVTSISMDDVDTTRVQNVPGGASSGELIDFGNNDYYYLDAIGAKAINYLDFNGIVPTGVPFTVTLNMSDGATVVSTFTPQTEAACLSINTTGAYISGTDLLGMTVTNTCSQTVTWTQAVVNWSGSSRTLSQIVVDGTTYFSGSANKGTTVNVNPDVTFTASQTRNITRLRFSNTMAGRWISLQFLMIDTSTTTATVSQANCLSVSTSGATIGGAGFVDLLGMTITNTCTAYALSWITTVVSWTPTSPSRSMTQIVVSGSSVYSGSRSSGQTTDHTNVAFSNSQSRVIDRFRFNGNMQGRTFTILVNMTDTSVKTVPAFAPP